MGNELQNVLSQPRRQLDLKYFWLFIVIKNKVLNKM
jgi:hypothetical protein